MTYPSGHRDFRYWLDVLARRRSLALQVALLVFGLVTLGTFLWPPTYRSTAKILVQDKRAQFLVSSDLQDDGSAKQAVAARPVTQEDLNSEIELLTSTYLIREAIADLPVPAARRGVSASLVDAARITFDLPVLGYDTLHRTPTMTTHDTWALKLERNLHPSVIKLSNIIEINFTAHDPNWARTFLARLVDHYLAYHAGLSADPQAEEFFNHRAVLLQARLDSSEEQLRQFEVRNGLTDVPAQKQALVTRLSDLQAQNNRAGADLAAAREQLVTLGNQLHTVPERIGKEVRSVQNASLQQIKPQVMQLKAERAELLSRYQPNSQRIREIDAKLNAAEKILAAENELQVQEESSDLNPVWVALTTNLEQAKTSVASIEATQNALRSEIQQASLDLSQITNNGVIVARLERQVTNDKEAYVSYVRKGEEANAAQGLNLSRILNVSVAQPPSLPLEPVYPRVGFNLLGGLLLAIALSFGAVYLEEQYDDRIYSPSSIYEASELKTVAIFGDEA